MSFQALTLGLSSAYGYVDLSDEEVILERRGARPISPTPTVVYFQPLPDVVSNMWRPNPTFRNMANPPIHPPPQEPETRGANLSKLVDKISSCFAGRKRSSPSVPDSEEGTASDPDDSSNGEDDDDDDDVFLDRLAGEQDSGDEQVREVRARRIYQRLHLPEAGEDPRPEVDQMALTDNVVVGAQLRRMSDSFQESYQDSSALNVSPMMTSRIQELTICFVVGIVISAMAVRYCTR